MDCFLPPAADREACGRVAGSDRQTANASYECGLGQIAAKSNAAGRKRYVNMGSID